ncbi:MAG TPA: cyclopropane-fatty-acyl-phospholipid synthase family protein [Streptosporangiaceae bacterium]|jgi:cyclopropane-fatty-acyl-phospholipid synthase
MSGVAQRLAPLIEQFTRGELPVRLRAWDGSEAGPPGPPTVVLRTPRAVRRMLWHPGELGLAQAYVTGELDVEGDLTQALRLAWHTGQERHLDGVKAGPAGYAAAVRQLASLGVLGLPPRTPAAQARVSGRLHSRARDRAVIAHHYDLTAAFYRLILDPQMAYSCARWESDDPGYTLEDAQRAKLDSICRQLRLAPGHRLLDVGCGWGSLSLHAARHFKAEVTAVTLSAEQGAFVTSRVRDLGLTDLVTVRIQDYREMTGQRYDAIASVEMGEHVGDSQYPAFCAQLHRLLADDGRLLIQQMSRGARAPGGGAFIESYIAPDMHMRPVGETVNLFEAAGFEVCQVEAMREHYVRTIRAWLANLEERKAEITALIGQQQVRVWQLYLHGGALSFEEGRMGVHQILAVRDQK